MADGRDLTVLLVEDNADHAELTLRALKDAHRVFWVKDGEEALDFLYRRKRFAEPAEAPRPGLILLDLKLPKIGGDEVLRRIRADESLSTIPVVMLTTSDRDEEVARSYRAGANSFVTKPVRFADFVERIRAIGLYWVSQPPPGLERSEP
jgi:DNA-binding response OmpR family regulator